MGERVLPDRATLKKWHASGMTYQAMADRWNPTLIAEGKDPVTRQSFSTACHRHGFDRRKLDHSDVLPKGMRLEHQTLYDTEMIRRWNARRKGKKFPPVEDQRINGWLQGLNDAKVVLKYERNTQSGWKPVKRLPTDDPECPVRLPKAKAKKTA
jgi:hypothetical protein